MHRKYHSPLLVLVALLACLWTLPVYSTVSATWNSTRAKSTVLRVKCLI